MSINKLKDKAMQARISPSSEHKIRKEYSGLDPLMVGGDAMSLFTLKLLYKHIVVGVVAKSDARAALIDALGTIMGDKHFHEFVEKELEEFLK